MKIDEFRALLESEIRFRNELAAQREAAKCNLQAADSYKRAIEDRDLGERAAIHAATARTDPAGTARLVVRLALDLSDGVPLSLYARTYLSEALLGLVKAPNRAAGVLGLAPKRGRQTKPLTPKRRAEIANFMHERSRVDGLPIRPTALRESAAELAAKEFKVSPETARNAYAEFRSTLGTPEDE